MDTATTPSLPPGFEDLLPWVSWARPSQRERYTHRIGTPLTEVAAF